MKMQKLDSKQVPQVIALGVLSAGVLGYGGWQLLGANSKPARAAAPAPVVAAVPTDVPAVNGPDGMAIPGVPGVPGNGPAAVNLVGPGGYNPDPFRTPGSKPVVKSGGGEAPSAPPAPVVREPKWPSAPELPSVGMGGPTGAPPAPAVPSAPAPPPAPVRPALTVNGIIDVEDGSDMALVEVDAQQRIVQVGDMIDNYRVKRISMDGLLLVNGRDRFPVSLAAPTSAPKG